MVRPKRLYKTKKDGNTRYYYLIKGKKRYINVPDGISQKQVVKINIKNVAAEGRRIKRRKKRVRVKYEKPIVDGMFAATIGAKTQLPVYFFQPQKQVASIPDQTKPLKIEELKGDDLKGITKLLTDSQKDNEQFKKLLLRNMEVKPQVPQVQLPSPTPTKERVTEISERTAEILGRAKAIRDRTPIGTPMETPMATPLREDDEETSIVREYTGIPETVKETYLPTQLKKLLGRDTTSLERSMYKNNASTRRAIVDDIKSKNPDFPDIPTSSFGGWKKEINTQYDISLRFAGKGASLSKGMYNDEIASVLKKRIRDYVPVIPIDNIDDMINYVKPGMKRFGFVINTNPSTSDGSGTDGYKLGHWRSVYFNNEDDFKPAEYFDPLAEGEPEPQVIDGMKAIAQKMNPETYFLFKNNNLKRQPDGTSSCGWHSIKFLDDRFQGIPWDEATGYNHYMDKHRPDDSKDGEKDVKNYFEKYKSYI